MKKFNRREAERELTAQVREAIEPCEEGTEVEVTLNEATADWMRIEIDIWNDARHDGMAASLTLTGKTHPAVVVASILEMFKARRTAWNPPY